MSLARKAARLGGFRGGPAPSVMLGSVVGMVLVVSADVVGATPVAGVTGRVVGPVLGDGRAGGGGGRGRQAGDEGGGGAVKAWIRPLLRWLMSADDGLAELVAEVDPLARGGVGELQLHAAVGALAVAEDGV